MPDSADINDLKAAFDGDKGMGNAHTRIETEHGVFTIDSATGKYTYTPNENLVYGEKYTDEFTIFVRDEKGAWSQQHVTINVTGGADADPRGQAPQRDHGRNHRGGASCPTPIRMWTAPSTSTASSWTATSTAAGTRLAPSRSSRSTQERVRGI